MGWGLRVFLPVYWLMFILIAYVLPVRWLRRVHGAEAEAFADPDPVMRFGERCRNVVFAIVLTLVAIHAVHPPALRALGVVPLLDRPLVRLVGVLLMLLGLLLVRTGQRGLGASWRIGFDPRAEPPSLVVHGIYRLTRNPVYLGLVLAAAGFALALPNAVSVAIAPLTWVLLQVRVRMEERWLLSAHGERYREYTRRTRRWV